MEMGKCRKINPASHSISFYSTNCQHISFLLSPFSGHCFLLLCTWQWLWFFPMSNSNFRKRREQIQSCKVNMGREDGNMQFGLNHESNPIFEGTKENRTMVNEANLISIEFLKGLTNPTWRRLHFFLGGADAVWMQIIIPFHGILFKINLLVVYIIGGTNMKCDLVNWARLFIRIVFLGLIRHVLPAYMKWTPEFVTRCKQKGMTDSSI